MPSQPRQLPRLLPEGAISYLQPRLLEHFTLPSFLGLLGRFHRVLDRLFRIRATRDPDKGKGSYPERTVQDEVEVVVRVGGNIIHVGGLARKRPDFASHPREI